MNRNDAKNQESVGGPKAWNTVPPPMASSIPLEVQHAENDEDDEEERRLRTMWEEKCKTLEEKFIKELAENNETWEKQENLLKLEIHKKDEEIQSLKEINDNLQNIFTGLIFLCRETCKGVVFQFHDCVIESHEIKEEQMKQVKLKLQRKDDMDVKMRQEIKLLKKMCLYQKSRRGFFFRRNIQDSKTVLERMKSKMKDKEKKEKKEKEAGCSAQTGHQ